MFVPVCERINVGTYHPAVTRHYGNPLRFEDKKLFSHQFFISTFCKYFNLAIQTLAGFRFNFFQVMKRCNCQRE